MRSCRVKLKKEHFKGPSLALFSLEHGIMANSVKLVRIISKHVVEHGSWHQLYSGSAVGKDLGKDQSDWVNRA